MDWIYGQIVGFLGNFFALMGNMGVELFELDWVNAIVLFFSRLGWALFAVSVVVCAFECGIEYSAGRGNLQQCALNVIKGFLAVSLFTVVPVRLYALSVSLQGTFSEGLTGYMALSFDLRRTAGVPSGGVLLLPALLPQQHQEQDRGRRPARNGPLGDAEGDPQYLPRRPLSSPPLEKGDSN